MKRKRKMDNDFLKRVAVIFVAIVLLMLIGEYIFSPRPEPF